MPQTTTLITAVRNEGPFLLEWIAYHQLIGFDRIMIFAHDDIDGSSSLLAALEAAGVILYFPNGPETSPARGHRHRAYTRALSHPAVQSADWAMALDADEFLTIHAGAGLLVDLLEPLSEADVISPAWRVFGNNGIIAFEDEPLTPRFNRAAPAKPVLTNKHLGLKSLFRPASVSKIGPHRPKLDTANDPLWLNGSGQDITQSYRESGWAANGRTLGYDLAQVNHYMIRSNEVFALHNLNTPPLGDDASPHSAVEYQVFNTNHAEDKSLQRFADPVAARITELKALPGVADAHTACVAIYHSFIAKMRDAAANNPDSPITPLLDAGKAKAKIREQINWWATHEARTKIDEVPQTPSQEDSEDGQIMVDTNHVAPRWLQDLRHSDHRRGWYWSDKKFAAQFTERSANTLVVSFDNLSIVNDPSLSRETWGYSFYRAEGWSHLGVMAFEKNWYRDDALFDFMETTGKALFKRFETVVLTGTSMGAYAATAFAKLSPGCTVVAFSPQSTLDKKLVPWEERFGSGRKQDWSGRYRDAPDDCGPARDVFVIYDPYFEPDRRHAERYYGDNITFLKSWYSSHKSALLMRRADILKTVMQQAVAGTLDAASYYELFRSRRSLIWYYNGLADHLIGAGHQKLADQLARHLKTIGRPGVARAIQARL